MTGNISKWYGKDTQLIANTFLSSFAESKLTARFNTSKTARTQTLTVLRHFSANGCLLPLCAVDGMAVTTVEGIGSTKTALHPVQVNTVDKKPPTVTLSERLSPDFHPFPSCSRPL